MANNSVPPNRPTEKKVPTLLDHVRAVIEKQQLFAHDTRIIVGVSGGPDSLVLLHCLRALRNDFNLHLHVAHLNHQLRGEESQADAEFVAALAQEWKLPASIEARDVQAFAEKQRLSLEEAARRVRYAFLAEVAWREGASTIAVGHHRDDQVETILMHFLRGTGLAGLRGMKYKTEMKGIAFGIPPDVEQPPLYLVRPLLDVTRLEIDEYARAHYLSPRIDRSNFEPIFFRNRLRYNIIPFLETVNPNLAQVLYRTAQTIADDYDLIDSIVKAEMSKLARRDQGTIVFKREAWNALHPALQRGTLRAAIQALRGEMRDIGWAPIEEARRIALEKNAGAEATLPGGLILVVSYNELFIAEATQGVPLPDLPLLHTDMVPLPPNGIVELPHSDWIVETRVSHHRPEITDRWSAVFDFAMCRGERYLRRRRPGDRFQPAGMQGHSRSLHDFLIDEKVQRAVRAQLPILVVGDRIVWVCGLREDDRARVTPLTREFWHVSFRKKNSIA